MARWAKRMGQAAGLSATALALLVSLSGCGGSSPPEPQGSEEVPHTTTPGDNADSTSEPLTTPKAANRDRLHQSFADATRNADNPPEDSQRPPDKTATDKPVFKLLGQVQSLWDTIRFVTPDDKKVEYSATIDTTLGPIEIVLFPKAAPNHVRNFVALARAGYYHGLCFDGIVHVVDRDEMTQTVYQLDQVRAGCPLGTGETGAGSIGYWLKPEYLTPEYKAAGLTHEPGVLSACRGSEPDSAATRFAITLSKASYLDDSYTIFGKVVKGLDVVRTMSLVPVIIDDFERDGSRRPERKIVIKSVTIHTREGAAGSGTEGTH